MSKYATLKADIDAKVYENAQQEITGANLNTLLKEMVDSLGKGYQFGGLVSPADPFTAGDEKMAFLASEAGRYPSFGNFSLVDGELALFIWDGTWKKQIISYYRNDQVYGVRHYFNNSSPDLTRIGDASLHRDLPVQSGMRRCVVNSTGDVLYYLGANDSTKKEDGTAADLSGATGQVMVEVPEHYRKTSLNAAQGYMDTEISMFPFDGAILVPRYLVSAYEATVDRENNLLSSVVNTSARYRGGDNNADWDGTYRSLLGLPATKLSLNTFRQYGRNRGTGWGCYDWNMHIDIFWLFAIEYATLNSQKAFNASLDAAGFHQGGLGLGVGNYSNWGPYNSYNPIIPCGFTNSLGNNTGVKTFSLTPAQAAAYGGEHSESVPSYRGIENPFGHLWIFVDGILCRGTGVSQEVYISRERAKYADTINDSYVNMGNSAASAGFVKAILASLQSQEQAKRVYGDLVSINNDGTSSTFFCDYTNPAKTAGNIFVARVGGSSSNNVRNGFVCSLMDIGGTFANSDICTRLCWSKI